LLLYPSFLWLPYLILAWHLFLSTASPSLLSLFSTFILLLSTYSLFLRFLSSLLCYSIKQYSEQSYFSAVHLKAIQAFSFLGLFITSFLVGAGIPSFFFQSLS